MSEAEAEADKLAERTRQWRADAKDLERFRELEAQGRLLAVDYPYRLGYRPWHKSHALHRLYMLLRESESRATTLLRRFATHLPKLLEIPMQPRRGAPPGDPCWANGWLPALDAISIYGLLAERNPRAYVEVGSGNSTKFARRAITDHGLRTVIWSIDPEPRAEVDALCDSVVRQALEDVDPHYFVDLGPEDMLFVDNSHRAFQGSDVTVFFTEILPVLPAGLVYGLHDILLPQDYPTAWQDRAYNEQYMLAAYLFGGADGDKVLLPNNFLGVHTRACDALNGLWQSPAHAGIEAIGTAFWMERRTRGSEPAPLRAATPAPPAAPAPSIPSAPPAASAPSPPVNRGPQPRSR